MVRKKLLKCCRQDSDREIYKKEKKGEECEMKEMKGLSSKDNH